MMSFVRFTPVTSGKSLHDAGQPIAGSCDQSANLGLFLSSVTHASLKSRLHGVISRDGNRKSLKLSVNLWSVQL